MKEKGGYRISRKIKGMEGFLVGLGDEEREALRRSGRERMRGRQPMPLVPKNQRRK